MIKSFDFVGGGLAWSVGNGRKIRIGVDPWDRCLQQHLLMEGTIQALREAGYYHLHQLAAPIQMVRWGESWIQAEDLGLHSYSTRDLEEYIRLLTRDHILLRDREDILIWNFAPVWIYSKVRIYRPEWNGTRS